MQRTTSTGRTLQLENGSALAPQQDKSPDVEPKTHPAGVWDLPAATNYRRLIAVWPDGSTAIEINMSDRVPEAIRLELKAGLERSLELSLQALKI